MSLKRSGSPTDEATATKKHCIDSAHFSETLDEKTTQDISQNGLPVLHSAIGIQKAIDKNEYIPTIGFCPLRDERRDENIKYETMRYGMEVEKAKPAGRKVREEDFAQVELFQQVHEEIGHVYQSGHLETPFKLKIVLPDYMFEASIGTSAVRDSQLSPYGEELPERLVTWFSHGRISGYGDLREHVTKVNEDVRLAREISSEHFEVEPTLLRQVEAYWQKHFYPSNVRAEPYKIHMYGPGGKFKAHRDTPQTGLVGTFLVGLGDNSTGGGLIVDSRPFKAEEGSWVAFYPDVPHEVKTVLGGHRAVLAFKIFRNDSQPTPDMSNLPPAVHSAAEQLLSSLELPFGLILDRKYCLGTTELSGVDAILHSSARKMQNVLQPVVLPILIHSSRFMSHGYENHTQIATDVKPLTSNIIDEVVVLDGHRNLDKFDFLFQRNLEELGSLFRKQWGELKGIPFFDLQRKEDSSVKWRSSFEEINYTGNEADGERGDSVYLSYALLCLPLTLDVQNLIQGR